MMEKTLREGLPGLKLELSEQIQENLCNFGKAVVEQNKVMNLTAITEPEQVAKLHLLDSLSVLSVQDLTGKKVIDVGCGAGFPGVPLKIACPGMEFATEMIARFAQSDAEIAQVPTPLRKDRRSGKPHLRTVRDGLRHLKFILFGKNNRRNEK